MALATYPVAEQDGGRLQLLPQGPGRDDLLLCQVLTRVPAAGVAHCSYVFFCCRELWACEYKALPQSSLSCERLPCAAMHMSASFYSC